MTLVDTGCGIEMPIVREDIFRKVSRNGHLEDGNPDLAGAEDSPLHIVGRSKKPLRLQFFNQMGEKINYFCRPLVSKNLKLPFILSAGDMIELDLIPRLKTSTATIEYQGSKIKIPLLKLKDRALPKRSVYHLTAKKNVTIKPFSEQVIDGVIDAPPGDVEKLTLFDPDENYMSERGLYVASSIDTLKPGGQTRILVMNPNDTPLTVNKHIPIGNIYYCCELQGKVVTEGFLDKVKSRRRRRRVLRIQSNKQSKMPKPPKAESLTEIVRRNKKNEEKVPEMTRDELCHKLATDLRLDKCKLLSPKEKDLIIELFIKYVDILALKYRDIGNCDLFEVEIDTGDAKPVTTKMRPAPYHLKEDLRNQIIRWLEQEVIEESNSNWGSAMRPVPKPDGSTRWCVDFRALNKITKPQLRPVANLQDKLRSLKAGRRPVKYYTTLDLSEAFHSLSLEPESREKTTFLTEYGAFKFKKLPFGLSIAPSAFSHVIGALEHGLNSKDPELTRRTLAYFDDIIMASENFEELYYSLQTLFEELRKLGLKIKPSKVELAKTEVSYLGHVITPEGIKMDPKRIIALKDWNLNITDQKGARSINGFLNGFRSFIKGYASRTTHIRKLASMKNPIWTKECQEEYEDIIDAASKDPLLRHPDFSGDANPFIITVDSSGTGTGATLTQEQTITLPDGEKAEREVTISYASRRKEDSERHYGSYKSELRGVVDAVVHYKEYLWGRKFIIRTDHKGLEYIRSPSNDKMPALAQRWQEQLSPFVFDIDYVPATKLKLVDALSRRPYAHDNYGNMKPAPIRDETFPFNDLTEEEANSPNPEIWVPYLKRNFREQFKELGLKVESAKPVQGLPVNKLKKIPRSRDARNPSVRNKSGGVKSTGNVNVIRVTDIHMVTRSVTKQSTTPKKTLKRTKVSPKDQHIQEEPKSQSSLKNKTVLREHQPSRSKVSPVPKANSKINSEADRRVTRSNANLFSKLLSLGEMKSTREPTKPTSSRREPTKEPRKEEAKPTSSKREPTKEPRKEEAKPSSSRKEPTKEKNSPQKETKRDVDQKSSKSPLDDIPDSQKKLLKTILDALTSEQIAALRKEEDPKSDPCQEPPPRKKEKTPVKKRLGEKERTPIQDRVGDKVESPRRPVKERLGPKEEEGIQKEERQEPSAFEVAPDELPIPDFWDTDLEDEGLKQLQRKKKVNCFGQIPKPNPLLLCNETKTLNHHQREVVEKLTKAREKQEENALYMGKAKKLLNSRGKAINQHHNILQEKSPMDQGQEETQLDTPLSQRHLLDVGELLFPMDQDEENDRNNALEDQKTIEENALPKCKNVEKRVSTVNWDQEQKNDPAIQFIRLKIAQKIDPSKPEKYWEALFPLTEANLQGQDPDRDLEQLAAHADVAVYMKCQSDLEFKRPEGAIREDKILTRNATLWHDEKSGTSEKVTQIVVPKHLRDQILQYGHFATDAGHPKARQMYQILRRGFYWPRMFNDIKLTVDSCQFCQNKAPKDTDMGQTTSKPHPRGIHWSIDMTNLQKTKKTGFVKLFTFVDYATRYVYAFPTRNEKAITLLPYIKHLMSHYGKGLVFHADQGRNFVSQEFVDFVEKAGCFMDYKAPYNPQASPIERYHLLIKGALASCVFNRNIPASCWDMVLDEALLIVRGMMDKGGHSPMMRMTGLIPKTELDLFAGTNPNESFRIEDEIVGPGESINELRRSTKTQRHPLDEKQVSKEEIRKDDELERQLEFVRWQIRQVGSETYLIPVFISKNMRTINPIHIQGMSVDHPTDILGRRKKQETSLQQMPVEQSTKHFKERKDELARKIHEENKQRKYGNCPVRTTYPHGSLVDIYRPLDFDHQTGKKSSREKQFRYYWTGPYVVTGTDEARRKVWVVPYDKISGRKVGDDTERGACEAEKYVRPTLTFARQKYGFAEWPNNWTPRGSPIGAPKNKRPAPDSTIETPIQDDKGQVVAKEIKTLVFAAPPAESKPTPIVEPQQDEENANDPEDEVGVITPPQEFHDEEPDTTEPPQEMDQEPDDTLDINFDEDEERGFLRSPLPTPESEYETKNLARTRNYSSGSEEGNPAKRPKVEIPSASQANINRVMKAQKLPNIREEDVEREIQPAPIRLKILKRPEPKKKDEPQNPQLSPRSQEFLPEEIEIYRRKVSCYDRAKQYLSCDRTHLPTDMEITKLAAEMFDEESGSPTHHADPKNCDKGNEGRRCFRCASHCLKAARNKEKDEESRKLEHELAKQRRKATKD